MSGDAGHPVTIHAVVRNRASDRALDALQGLGAELPYRTVESGDLAAVVTDGPGGAGELLRHGRVVSRLLRRSTVVPVPLGLSARDDDAVRRFLEARRVPLVEALDYLEDGYELRLHVSARSERRDPEELRTVAHHVYEQLQGQARAARVLPPESAGSGGSVLSAAFLIPRNEWIRFVEQVSDWEGRYPGVRLDVTGPWAAWDFVHLTPAPGPADGDRRENEEA